MFNAGAMVYQQTRAAADPDLQSQSTVIRVYLDDERIPPEGWTLVRWPQEAIALLERGGVDEISLDHDLGDDRRGTGYDVVLWVERAVAERGFVPPQMLVHSANSSARMKMEAGIAAIARLLEAQRETR